MNWMRTILDGFAMAVYFNLFAAAVALYKPCLLYTSVHFSAPPLLLKRSGEIH